MASEGTSTPVVIERGNIQQLLDALISLGFSVIAPKVQDGAIVYDEVRSIIELPVGRTSEQQAGVYRLKRRTDSALFGYVVGPHSWKKYLFRPQALLWKAQREGQTVRFVETPVDHAKFVFFGVRSCELHALAVQDKVFMDIDPTYRARRERLFVVAVNCGLAGETCFCTSMNTGPRATGGFDLALTEVLDGRHYFVVEIGTARGAEVMSGVSHRPADASELAEIGRAAERAKLQMGRSMDATGVKKLLGRHYDHRRWDDVAGRCLSCANCTLVCPTCFCSTVEDTADLTGEHAERWRKWDSCFTMDFSYLHGGSIRGSTKARYRQWMTHKLSTWWDQFGTSGCVGCGRCITWCPVGIDITAEVMAIRTSEKRDGKRDD